MFDLKTANHRLDNDVQDVKIIKHSLSEHSAGNSDLS